MTENVESRLTRHNGGREKVTKPYRPFTPLFSKEFRSRLEARDFEKFLKVKSNKEKLIRKLQG